MAPKFGYFDRSTAQRIARVVKAVERLPIDLGPRAGAYESPRRGGDPFPSWMLNTSSTQINYGQVAEYYDMDDNWTTLIGRHPKYGGIDRVVIAKENIAPGACGRVVGAIGDQAYLYVGGFGSQLSVGDRLGAVEGGIAVDAFGPFRVDVIGTHTYVWAGSTITRAGAMVTIVPCGGEGRAIYRPNGEYFDLIGVFSNIILGDGAPAERNTAAYGELIWTTDTVFGETKPKYPITVGTQRCEFQGGSPFYISSHSTDDVNPKVYPMRCGGLVIAGDINVTKIDARTALIGTDLAAEETDTGWGNTPWNSASYNTGGSTWGGPWDSGAWEI